MPATYGDVTERQCKIRSGQLGGISLGSETSVRGSSPRRLYKSAPCGVGGAIQVKETAARSPAMAQTRRAICIRSSEGQSVEEFHASKCRRFESGRMHRFDVDAASG